MLILTQLELLWHALLKHLITHLYKKTNLIFFGKTGIDYSLADYLQLVDGTGRAIIQGKRGNIPKELPDILRRLDLNPDTWLDELNAFKTSGITAVGTTSQLKEFCLNVGKKFSCGLRLKPAFE